VPRPFADAPDTARRRGRPRRISNDEITQAVLEIGTQHVTMRRVAEHLGVSLPGLYHHVRNQDELLRMAATRAMSEFPPPRYDGQHWAQWLRTYATYVRSALAAEPALLQQLLSGRIEVEGEMEYVAETMDALVAQGFEPDQAMAAWAAVSELALGSVTEVQRENLRVGRGAPWLSRIHVLLARRDDGELPGLRAVAASGYQPFADDQFDRRLRLLLTGISIEFNVSLADTRA
jgi:AcrR family transcriptional regulator